MKILKTMGIGILYFIGTILFATILALGTIFTYFALQILLFGRGDYLLLISNNSNIIPVLMIMILIIYAAFKIKEKFFKRKEVQTELIEEAEPVDTDILSKKEQTILNLLNKLIAFEDIISKVFKVIKVCYIPALLIALYYGMTSYAILYSDSIKVSSPMKPAGTIYKYSDIKRVDVGIEKENRNSCSPYYTVIFSDKKSLNLFGGSMIEDKGVGFEYILIDLDKKLKTQGVTKTVNKTNFDNYAKDLDKSFVSRVEQLFNNK
ncbi:hypothetical protein [Candidatus Clostridium stratigraminis]|uniref:Uncharacterized protein n=1 Tax=Candidatus Clostridium stratigraminis TaxID=3381661 RepID=A0ABW8T0Y2_9CLOT